MECEYKAMLAFATDLAISIKFLKQEHSDPSTDGNAEAKITGWMRIIRGLKFIATILTQIDLGKVLKILSKETQSDASLIIHHPEQRHRIYLALVTFQTTLGKPSSYRLEELKRGKYSFGKIARSSDRDGGDDDGDGDDEHTDAERARELGSFFERDSRPDIGRPVASASLSAAKDSSTRKVDIQLQGQEKGDVEAYLLKYHRECADVLVREFDKRVARLELAEHLAVLLFRFDSMPPEIRRGLSGFSHDSPFLVKVRASISFLVQTRYKRLGAGEVYSEWCRAVSLAV